MSGLSLRERLEELAAASPDAPVRVGRYDVVGRLGSGGMGTVYRAIDRERQSPVALKTLSAAETGASVWIKNEFRVARDLEHENLVPVYELASDAGLWFFSMELVEGTTLMAWARGRRVDDPSQRELPLSRSDIEQPQLQTTRIDSAPRDPEPPGSSEAPTRPIVRTGESPPATESVSATLPSRPFDAIRRAFGEIARGLIALHDSGLRHGDVKPSNVIVRPDDRAVLVDFGLAASSEDGDGVRSSTGGTPVYMPPEQLKAGTVGPESDWYAFGATLYRILTGRLPFFGGSKLDLYFKKLHMPPKPPHRLLADVPVDLSELSCALMAHDPAARPSRDEVLAVLLGDGSSSVAHRPGPTVRDFVGREDELFTMERAYGSARGGTPTVVHTHGPSGIGKSSLLTAFLSVVGDVDAALVMRGRCYERENVPYKGFDPVLDQLARALSDDALRVDESALPEWMTELAFVFPALADLRIVSDRAFPQPLVQNEREVKRRAWVALGELIAAIQSPIVIAIDDLQWADTDTAELLCDLLEAGPKRALLFVLLFRPTVGENPALRSYFELASRLAERNQLIDLPIEPLKPTEALELARAALVWANRPVTEERVQFIAQESQGIPFFIEELAQADPNLDASEGTINLSLARAIQERVAKLTPDLQRLMELVAVANRPIPQSVLFEAASMDNAALRSLLGLRRASLVSWLGSSAEAGVLPYHDRIREAVVDRLDQEALLGCHLALGRALKRHATEDRAAATVFEAIHHLGAAEPKIDDEAERLATAELHRSAGELANRAAAFSLALAAYEAGLHFLPEDAWSRRYELTLDLHAGALRAAYLTADADRLATHIAKVKKEARSSLDQLPAWEIEIDAFVGRRQYRQSVAAGRDALAMFGVHLPEEPTESDVGAAVEAALGRLEATGPDGLRAMPDLDDPATVATTRILVRMSPAAYFARPALLPIIASNLIATSFERGVSAATPYALALFGIVLNTIQRHELAHRWGQLALELLDRFPDRRLEAATRHILYNLVCCWTVPLESILEPLRNVFELGCRYGDYEYASYAAHGYVHNALYAGKALEPLRKTSLQLSERMAALGQVNAVHVHAPFEQLIKALIGELPDPTSLDDETYSESEALVAAEEAGSRSGIFVIRIVMGMLRYHFGHHHEAAQCFSIATEHLDGGPSVWHQPMLFQFGALAKCAVWEATPAAERRTPEPPVDEDIASLKRLARLSDQNFTHRVEMVEAERARVLGDRASAARLLKSAIRRAQAGGWINDVALANELAARCAETDTEAKRSLRSARAAYVAWGAEAKASQIAKRLGSL